MMHIVIISLWVFLIGVIVIPLLKYFSEEIYFLVDVPDNDPLKIHKKNIPLVGGLAMSFCFLTGIIAVLIQYFSWQLVFVGIAFLPIFLLGLYDDVMWKHISNTKPLVKFLCLLVVTFFSGVLLYGVGIRFNVLPFIFLVLAGNFMYVFIVINAVNYQDGMDGLAGGLVAISLVGFILVAHLMNYDIALNVSLIALGSTLAFLIYNLPSAKIFMGDSGSYSLGLILTVLAISFSRPYNVQSVVAPIFIVGLPVIDGVFTNIRRLIAGKSIFHGDRSHFYDKLMQKGFSVKETLFICYSIQAILVIVGIIIYFYV